MAFDTAVFQATFPQFVNTSAATINNWAGLVANSPMASWFATATLTDQQLIVAHVGFLFSQAGTISGAPGGAVVSASQGGVSASFQAPPVKTGWQYYLSGSPYGQMLWASIQVATAGGTYIGGLPERNAFRKVGGTFQ